MLRPSSRAALVLRPSSRAASVLREISSFVCASFRARPARHAAPSTRSPALLAFPPSLFPDVLGVTVEAHSPPPPLASQADALAANALRSLYLGDESSLPTFASSRKGDSPAWANPLPLSSLVTLTLSAARFRPLQSDAEGGVSLSIDAVVDTAMDCEIRETKGARSWSPAIYQTLRYFFKLTHSIGDSHIVADPIIPQWTYTIPLDLTPSHFMEHRPGALRVFNMCSHHELPFGRASIHGGYLRDHDSE